MPALGADMEQGRLVEWLVKPGDYVHRGDMVAVVDTEKADIDVECFEEGVVAALLVEVGTTVPVGAARARITQTPATGAEPAAPAAPATPAATAAVTGTGAEAAVTEADVRRFAAALLLKASALAARDVPEVDGFFTEGSFQPSTAVHLGVAVALRQGGLVAPALHDADTLVGFGRVREEPWARIDELLQKPEEL